MALNLFFIYFIFFISYYYFFFFFDFLCGNAIMTPWVFKAILYNDGS